jgi:hypothetical protein
MAEDEDILGWSPSNVEAFAERESAEEVVRAIRRLVQVGDDDALGVLSSFLAARAPACSTSLHRLNWPFGDSCSRAQPA